MLLWTSLAFMIPLRYETVLQEEAPPCAVNTDYIFYNEKHVNTHAHTLTQNSFVNRR